MKNKELKINSLKSLGLKRVMKSYCPVLPFYSPIKASEYNWFCEIFWWYKKTALGSNRLKRLILKALVKGYVEKRLCWKWLMKKYVIKDYIYRTIAFAGLSLKKTLHVWL